MIELKVYANNTWKELDTYGNENVALTFQVDDVRDIANKNASYSKDFNLPATKRNNRFFEHYYDLDRYTLNFNAYSSYRCELYVDSILVLEGYLKLISTLEKQTEISYKVVIFNDVANLIDYLGDDTIENLDLSDIDHTFNYDTVIASWYGTDTLGAEVPYTYSMINSGNMYEDEGNIYYTPHQNFTLNLKLKYIIDKIFQYAGFSYNSSFFNSDEFSRLYFDTTSIKDYGTEIEPYEILGEDMTAPLNVIGGDTTYNGEIVGNGAINDTIISVDTITNDTLGEFNGTTATFTASNNLLLQFIVQVPVVNISGQTVNLTMYINGEGVDTQSIISGDPNDVPAVPNLSVLVFAGAISLLSGQTAQITFASDYDVQLFSAGVYDFGIADNNFKYQLYISNASQQDLVQTQLGNIKLADIIKDTFTMFNLIATDKGNKELNIEPYISYISNDIVDWTNKVDINEIELENIEIPRRLIFKHAQESEDYYLDTYQTDNGIEYGTHIVNFDVDNEEDKVIQLKVFSAPFIKTLEGTDMTIQHIGKLKDYTEIERYKNKPRIVYRKTDADDTTLGVTTYPYNSINQFIQWQTVADLTNYPQLTHFNKLIVDCASTDNSYLFGNINPSAILDLPNLPVNTLFSRFWRDYIEEKYNTENRILKCKAKLTATDILNLDFSKTYRISDQNYRLNKVDYNTDKNKLTSIELIRI